MKTVATMCLLACTAGRAFSQDTNDLVAKQRLFKAVGPGLRAVKRGPDGRTYILASPSPGLLVFDGQGKQVLSINEMSPGSAAVSTGRALITFGEDCDADADGTIYVADRAANQIQVFSSGGKLLHSIPVPAPVSIAALPEGEVAVATLRESHLVIVYDKNGREVREFGEPEQLTERADLNRFLNIGQLTTDAQDHLYYAFGYWPEPMVRQFDRAGYGGQDIQYTAIEALQAAQARRKEIERQERRKDQPMFRRILTAAAVDRPNGEVWMALGNALLHFDKDGNRRTTYKIYTPELARLEASTMLIESDRLIIGNDPLGIYEFERPDKKITK